MTVILLCLFFISFNSFFIPFFFGKKLGLQGTFLFIILSSMINMILSIYLFTQMLSFDQHINIELYSWISIELINISFGFFLDPISSSMLIIITYISFCAHLYSFEYLKGDAHLNRFFCYLSLFTFFMILLVLSENLIQLFIGWEGVGICSYLLINYWSNRIQANKSSILAVLANKVGDLTLLVGALLLQSVYHSISFVYLKSFSLFYDLISNINIDINKSNLLFFYSNELDYNATYLELQSTYILEFFRLEIVEIIALMLIISCIGKSAQFGFHFWLPEAMEGPTPVSSLIHAATMVTAGIFLILRMSDFFSLVSTNISVIVLIGSITLFFASSIGITQTDIKKVIAYSTCSQLGYMFLSCGFQNYTNGMYHLFIHAFFKALLFLTAGYLIHLLSNEQDIRKMGGLLKVLPFSYSMMLIGSYSLVGLPFLSGFYSKDPLIENLIIVYYNSFFFSKNALFTISLILALATVLITSLYSIKSIIDVYYLSFKGFLSYVQYIHYSSFYIQIPLMLLCFATIYSGYLFQESFIGLNNDFLSKSMYVSKSNIHYFFDLNTDHLLISNLNNIVISEFYPYYRFYLIHILVYTIMIFILIKIWVRDFFFFCTSEYIWDIYNSIIKKYIYINRLIIINEVESLLLYSKELFLSLFDKGIIELIGPYGIYAQIKSLYKIVQMQSGFLYHYIGYIYMVLILSLLFIFVIY